MYFNKALPFCLFVAIVGFSNQSFCQIQDTILPQHKVSLKEAHIGSLEIDSQLLDSYERLPNNIRQFYLEARNLFETTSADFTSKEIIELARTNHIELMGGPMLGDLKEDRISIWLRPSKETPLVVKVIDTNNKEEKIYRLNSVVAGKAHRIVCEGLSPATSYTYVVLSEGNSIAEGGFSTAASIGEKSLFRLTFGSGFHKIGLHNPNLMNTILKRKPHAMVLLGDLAVDDRENNINLHQADYLLRDISKPWKALSAHVSIYASWDDHDYLNNDLSGIPDGFSEEDRAALRKVWHQNWNNPKHDEVEGLYFNSRMGSVELIMLDTRSYREISERGQYNSYLGSKQLQWLKATLKNSSAPFKVISSGTMWSDDISKGKDSWGTWDTLAREEIFNWIETENIKGVLLISGDRHGARGFKIPRPSGFNFYEFEAASLGGVPGPEAMAKDPKNQLFGYPGIDLRAFGEFSFDLTGDEPLVIFRLVHEFGSILEEHILTYDILSPK